GTCTGTMNLNGWVGRGLRTAPHFGGLRTAHPTVWLRESFRRGGQRTDAGRGFTDRFAQWNREPKRRTCAQHAAQTDGAAHQLNEFAADGQSQTGSSVLAGGGGIGLRERLEQLFLRFLRNADARIADRAAQM